MPSLSDTVASPGPFASLSYAILFVIATGCSSDRLVQPPEALQSVDVLPTDDLPSLFGTLRTPLPVELRTYDGSNEVVHPDLLELSTPWHGRSHWLAATPYPNSQSRYENPSLYVSESGRTWDAAPGVVNPIAQTSRGYLSDPDLVFNASRNELWLYYREVENEVKKGHARHVADNVLLTTSGDGVHWTPAIQVMRASRRFVVSPAIVRRSESAWSMWMVDAGTRGCDARATRFVHRSSTDGIHWRPASRVDLVQPGYIAWHIDVQYLPARRAYWALLAAYPRGASCMSTELFLATSADGTQWTTYPSPVLRRGAIPQFRRNVYRSTFAYDAATDSVTLWYTGAAVAARGPDGEQLRWSAAVSRASALDLLAHVARPREHRVTAPAENPDMLELARTNAVP